MVKAKCGRCGYTWDRRTKQPKRCPKCQVWLDWAERNIKDVKKRYE